MNNRNMVLGLIFLSAIFVAAALFQNRSTLFSDVDANGGKGAKKANNFQEDLRIKKYPGNWACFKFETPDGIIVVTDPYFNVDECISIVQRVHPKIVIPAHGTKDIGISIASKMGKNLECVKTGEVRLRKSELNKIEGTRIMDLDTAGVNEKINYQ